MERNDELSRLLKASIARETNKPMKDEFNTTKALAVKNQQMAKRIVELETENKKLRGVIDIMGQWTEEPLQAVEQIFKTDPGLLNYESMAQYVTIARFMGAYKQRKHIAEEVDKRMKSLPS